MTVTTFDMGAAVTVPTMTAEDAQTHDTWLRASGGQQRVRLYIMQQHRGFQHFAGDDGVRYQNVEDYAKDRLDIAPATVGDWLSQVQVTIDAQGLSIEKLMASVGSKKKDGILLPSTTTRVLRQLPTADLRKEAVTQMAALKESETMTPAEQRNELPKLVNQLMIRDGLRQKPGRPSKAEIPPAETVETVRTVSSPPAPAASLSVPPTATTAPSEQAPAPPTFEFDDAGNTPTEEQASAPNRADAINHLVQGVSMRFYGWELGNEENSNILLVFKLSDGTLVYGEIPPDRFEELDSNYWDSKNGE